MSRPAILRSRDPPPEPPSIAARRRNSNAASLQLQGVSVDPKGKSYATYLAQTPSPKQTFASAKQDYFRHGAGAVSTPGAMSPYALSNLNSTNQQQVRRMSVLHGQPPTPSVHQHVPAWNRHDEWGREGLLSEAGRSGDEASDPLHILDTLPAQQHGMRPGVANAPASDSRCGTLRRPVPPADDRRTNTWPKEMVLNPTASSSTLASRRMQALASTSGHGTASAVANQSRPFVQNLRPVEPEMPTKRSPELGRPPQSTSHLNHAAPADCFI